MVTGTSRGSLRVPVRPPGRTTGILTTPEPDVKYPPPKSAPTDGAAVAERHSSPAAGDTSANRDAQGATKYRRAAVRCSAWFGLLRCAGATAARLFFEPPAAKLQLWRAQPPTRTRQLLWTQSEAAILRAFSVLRGVATLLFAPAAGCPDPLRVDERDADVEEAGAGSDGYGRRCPAKLRDYRDIATPAGESQFRRLKRCLNPSSRGACQTTPTFSAVVHGRSMRCEYVPSR